MSRRFRVAAIAALVIFAVSNHANSVRAPTMDDSKPLLAEMQALGLDAYLRKDTSTISGLPREALQQNLRGLFLSAPPSLDAQVVQPVPGLLLLVRPETRTKAFPFPLNAVVVATDLDRGVTYAGPAFIADPTKRPYAIAGQESRSATLVPPLPLRSPPEQELLERAGHGLSASFIWLDFAKLLNLPKQAAHYLVRVISYDEFSNAANIDVQAKAGNGNGWTPAVAQALMDRQSEQRKINGEPNFERTAKTPANPGPGAVLVLDGPREDGNKRRVWARGSFRLKLTAAMLVAAPADRNEQPKPSPSAVVPASILLIMKGRPAPVHMHLEVPIISQRALRTGDLVEAIFEVDLAPKLPPKFPADPVQVYLQVGPSLTGPYSLDLSSGNRPP